MKKVPRSNPTPLSVALGDHPLEVWVAGELIAHDEHTPVTIRRAVGDQGLGEPASCSFTVAVDTLPAWAKGDPVEVKLSDAALATIYGGAEVDVRTNYAMNPSVRQTMLTGYYNGGGEGWTVVTNYASYPNDGPVSSGEYVHCTRTTTLAAVGTVPIGYGQPTGQPALRWKAAPGDNFISMYVRTNHPDLVVRPRINLLDAASSTVLAQSAPDTFQIGGGAWVRVHQYADSPSADTLEGTFELVVETASRSWQSGDTIDATGVLAEWTDQLGAFFDGSSANVDGLTHAWMPGSGTTGTGSETAYSTQTSTEVLIAKGRARYRFKGKVSDLAIQGDRTAPAHIDVVATSTTAKLGQTYLGDTPWPVEGLVNRAQRIITAAKALDPDLDMVDPDWFSYNAPVRATDVDRRSVADLLGELVATAGPIAALVERRDGSVLFTVDRDIDLPKLWLTHEVVRSQLRSSVGDRVNDVTVLYGPEQGPPEGTELRRNRCLNPSFETAAVWTFTGPVPTYDFTGAPNRARSLKVVTTAVATTAGYQDILAAPGQRWTLSAYFKTGTLTGAWKMTIQALNASNVEQGRVAVAIPAGLAAWTRLSVHYPNTPAGTTKVRILPYWLDGMASAGETFYVDAVLCERDTDATPGVYFDGATPDGEAYLYNWTTAIETTASTVTSTGRAPRYSRQVVDQVDIDANGRHPARVDTAFDLTADPADTSARADAAMSAGEWSLPQLEVDILPLIDGRIPLVVDPVDAITRPPLALAGRILQAEAGSQSRVSTYGTDDQRPHLPSLDNVVGHVISLQESISSHAWRITTTNERQPT